MKAVDFLERLPPIHQLRACRTLLLLPLLLFLVGVFLRFEVAPVALDEALEALVDEADVFGSLGAEIAVLV